MALAYIHIPFCERKCVYCDFYSTESMESKEAFLDALDEELRVRSSCVASGERFASVFFGGGTPSLLTGRQIAHILNTLRETYAIEPDAEITMEANPGTVTLESLKVYRAAGVNRISFGVQSFFDDDLQFLSRIHTAAEARTGIELARKAGFENINLDLMFSLPGQTPERWRSNLEQAYTLGTTHISCYSLTIEQGTPLAGMVDRGTVTMPQQENDAELYDLTMETLETWGFRQYEVSNYALPGYECRHNLGYWRLEDYLGFGPSAHSTWKRRREWNVKSVRGYIAAIQNAGSAVTGGEDVTNALRRTEYIFLRLRSEGIDLAYFREEFGEDFCEENRDEVERLLKRGYLAKEGEILRLTRRGMQFADEICVRVT